MAIQRSLRLAGYVLVALTIFCLFVLPTGMVPALVGVVLAGLAALDLLALAVVILLKDRSFRGFVQALVALALVLVLGGGACAQLFSNAYYVELRTGETATLVGHGMDGYALAIEDTISEDEVAIMLTQPDQVTIHETISPTVPMNYHGLEVHPLGIEDNHAVFLVRHDPFRLVIRVGAILFLIGLGLSVVPSVRKRGED